MGIFDARVATSLVAGLAVAGAAIVLAPGCALVTDLSTDGYVNAEAGAAVGCTANTACDGGTVCCFTGSSQTMLTSQCVEPSKCTTASSAAFCASDADCNGLKCVQLACKFVSTQIGVCGQVLQGCTAK